MKKYPHGLTLNAVCAAIDDYQRNEYSMPEEGILAALNTLLGQSDIAEEIRSLQRTADTNMAVAQALHDDMYHWKQRAEAAEAKLVSCRGALYSLAHVARRILPDYDEHPEIQRADDILDDYSFIRPAPAVSLAPVSNCLSFFASVIKSGESWSATCQRELDAAREALRNIKEAK